MLLQVVPLLMYIEVRTPGEVRAFEMEGILGEMPVVEKLGH